MLAAEIGVYLKIDEGEWWYDDALYMENDVFLSATFDCAYALTVAPITSPLGGLSWPDKGMPSGFKYKYFKDFLSK